MTRHRLDGLDDPAHASDDDLPVVAATISETGSGATPRAAVEPLRDELSRYTVESEVARGGLGRILKAHDARLDRPVALKESLTSGGLLDERFRREAAITARLQHPSIVPIYDSGSWTNGAPYYVMKLLGGSSTLKELVARAPDLDGRLALLPHVIAVADAIAYAHSLDVIHRDLKPSNVLVGSFGETLVIDWGLAKDLARPSADDDLPGDPYRSAAPELTSLGSVIGTPQYMAPEQARGEAVDKRADVYALGALLYFVLSGAAPYEGGTSADVLRQVRAAAPPSLPSHSRAIPQDLVAIVDKAMARAAADRYASAGELVEDLKRFQTGQLVGAHQYSAATLVWRWMARHRTPLAVALLFFVASTVMALVGVRRIARARDVADSERAAAVAKRNELILLQARSTLEADPTKALAWLKSYPLDGADWTTVQSLAARARSLGVARHLLPTGIVTLAMALPGGQRVVTVGSGRQAMLWDLDRGVALDRILIDDQPAAIAVARDGSRVFFGTVKGLLLEWNLVTKRQRVIGRQEGMIAGVELSPDERLLASAGPAGARLWNLADGSSRLIAGHHGVVLFASFSHDGRALYSTGDDGIILRQTLPDGRSSTIQAGQGGVSAFSLSDDDALLASGGRDGTLRVWPADGSAGGRLLASGSGPITSAHFLPHSHRLASESGHVETVWDADSGRPLAKSAVQPGDIRQHELSPDGSLIALGTANGSLQVWDWTANRAYTLPGATSVMALAFAADGTLVSGGMDHETRVWPPALRPIVPLRALPFEARFLTNIALSPDGTRMAVAGGTVAAICRTATGECRPLGGITAPLSSLAFSADGTQVLTGGWDGAARLWSVADGSSTAFRIGGSRVDKAIFLPDGRRIAAAGSDGAIDVWTIKGEGEGTGGAPLVLSGHKGDVRALAASPDGQWLASVGDDRTVRLWDLAQKRGRIVGSESKPTFYVAFAPDSRRFASGSDDGTVRLWSVADGSSRVIAHFGDFVSGLAFSPDGRFVASGSWDGLASVWDLAAGRARRLAGHDARIRSLAWSPDSRFVATGSDDRTVRVWTVASGAVDVLRGHDGPVRGLDFAFDGSLASASEDHVARLWPVVRAGPAPREPSALSRWMADTTTATTF